ncbi:MAG TPA: SDR family NAD(P)-dependent oxidoreductase [Actinomycetota bacterium]|jgi:citronellol/citronellal dehydrogenase|nr:SDR family NAD(P)-dependent oxidoreductase [Actinomycetota bacterium]
MSGKVAVVTGASRGIGKRLSEDLASNGYDVVCTARSSSDSPGKLPGTIDETASLVEAAGAKAMPVALDVRDEDAVTALADRVFTEWGQVDLLINNAAVAPPGLSLQEPVKRWKLAVDVNVNGPFYFMHAFAPLMNEGRVINISSGASLAPQFERASYTVTKRALEALTECHAWELRNKVAVNCIQLELSVWTEGYTATLGEGNYAGFEDPVIMSDAVLWLAEQPIDYTGHVLTIAKMREMGVVRPVTQVGRT